MESGGEARVRASSGLAMGDEFSVRLPEFAAAAAAGSWLAIGLDCQAKESALDADPARQSELGFSSHLMGSLSATEVGEERSGEDKGAEDLSEGSEEKLTAGDERGGSPEDPSSSAGWCATCWT